MLPFPEKKFLAEISTRFFEILKFLAQKSQKIDFFKFHPALYPRQNICEKKRLGRLEAYLSA